MVTKEHHFPSIGEEEDVTPPPPAPDELQSMQIAPETEMSTASHQVYTPDKAVELPADALASSTYPDARSMSQKD